MADGAYTCRLVFVYELSVLHYRLVLVTASVCIYDDAALCCHRSSVKFRACAHLELVRPDSVGVATRSLSESGIKHKHLVALAVAVPVVAFPVGTCLVGSLNSFLDHLSYTNVAC